MIPEQLNYYVQGLAALLIHDLGRSHDLLNNRVPTIAQAINPGLQPIYQPERFEVFGRSSRIPLNVEKLKLRSLHQLLVQKLLILFESPANRSMEIPPLVGELDAMRRTLLLPPIKGRDEITAEYLGALLREFDSATLGSVKPFTHDSPDGNTLARLKVHGYLAETSLNMHSKALFEQLQSTPPSVALPER